MISTFLLFFGRFLLGAKPHGSISGDELRESFEALATMADVSLGGLVFMALNGTRLNVLGADQLSELGCLAGGAHVGGGGRFGSVSIHVLDCFSSVFSRFLKVFRAFC